MPVGSAQGAPLETIEVGDISVSFIPDGLAPLSETAMFPGADEALWQHHPDLFDEDGKLVMSLGGFLIRSGDRKILVDLGFGPGTVAFDAAGGEFRGGRMLESLGAAGLTADDVDTVFYTHLHIDHVGWTATDGALTFPNARHQVGEGEFEFWRDNPDHPMAALGPNPETVVPPLTGRIESVADGAAIATGVNVVGTPGHTPGHCSLVISSGQDRAIILGDMLHCPLQLSETDVNLAFDTDPAMAAATRARMVAELEGDERTVTAQGHFGNSVFGRVLRGTGKKWTPVN